FFGRTPASRGDEIRAASPVNLLGRVLGDPTVFKAVRSGTTVRVERA
ncbi:MAG: cyclophilin-like family protein, partial [Candidatus Rokuibacteriota bacterium]